MDLSVEKGLPATSRQWKTSMFTSGKTATITALLTRRKAVPARKKSNFRKKCIKKVQISYRFWNI